MAEQQAQTTQNAQRETGRKSTSRLDLASVAFNLGLANVEYDPAELPAVVYRVKDSNMVVTIYASGQMEVFGATRMEDVEAAEREVSVQVHDKADGKSNYTRNSLKYPWE